MDRKEFFENVGKSALALGLAGPLLNTACSRPGKKRTGTGMTLSYEVKRITLKHAWTLSRNTSDFKDNVIVKVEKDGVVGYGEAAPNVRYNETPESTVKVIKKAVSLFEKSDPWNFVDLGFKIQELDKGQTAAKCALDMALMDWVVKSLGVPLYQYLGLDKSKAPVTSFSISIDTPEIIKQKVLEAEPYEVLKIKLGKDNDEEIVDAVRSVTNKPFRVDINEGWTDKFEAYRKCKWLISEGVEFIEQPMPSSMMEETRWLRDQIDVPIIADEAVKTARDIPRLAEAYDGVNIKLMKAGGLQEALRMVWLAKTMGMQVMLGCMIETSVAISPAAGISPLVDYADLDGALLITDDPFSGATFHDGKMVPNDEPGLGIRSVV